MSISVYEMTVPMFQQSLEALANVLKKAEAFAEERKIDPAVLVNARLAPDMLALRTRCSSPATMPRARPRDLPAATTRATRTMSRASPSCTRVSPRRSTMSPASARRISKAPRIGRSSSKGGARAQLHGHQLSQALRAAEFLLPPHNGLRHPASQWRDAVQDRLHRRRSLTPANPPSCRRALAGMMGGRGFLIGAGAVAASAACPFSAPAVAVPVDWPARLVAAARSQIGVTTLYDPAYVKLGYPDGDVPRERGVCTDVIVRAYRDGLGVDLQVLVHEDMQRNFVAYPASLGHGSAGLQHRPPSGAQSQDVLPPQASRARPGSRDFAAGDLVSQLLPGNLAIAIVSESCPKTDRRRSSFTISAPEPGRRTRCSRSRSPDTTVSPDVSG